MQHDVPDLALNAMLNVLVLKVVKQAAMRGDGFICFTDTQGNPVKGVTVTLDPEAKEKVEVKKP